MNNYYWINEAFFETLLKKHHCDNNIKLIDFEVVPALLKGENYSSDILRASVDYLAGQQNKRNQKYILKSALIDPEMADMLEEFDVFLREIVVYRDILPKVEQLLLSVGDKAKLAPNCHHISENKPKCFVFEDLSLNGFKNSDRRVGLNFEQAKLVLIKLAKWHAATAVMHDQDPSSMKHHNYRNINEETKVFWPVFTNSLLACADLAKDWPTTKHTAEKLYKFAPKLMLKGCEVYTRNENDFNVLNHGDLWVNNIMFQYNSEGKMVDVAFVDYAVGYFGSPAIDLSYLLYISCTDDIREQEWDNLLQFYHEELTSTLTKLKYSKKIPSLTDIQIEILKKGMVGVMYSTFLIPLRLLQDTTHADLKGLLDDTEEAKAFRKDLFGHPNYQKRMEYLLDYYDRKGYLG